MDFNEISNVENSNVAFLNFIFSLSLHYYRQSTITTWLFHTTSSLFLSVCFSIFAVFHSIFPSLVFPAFLRCQLLFMIFNVVGGTSAAAAAAAIVYSHCCCLRHCFLWWFFAIFFLSLLFYYRYDFLYIYCCVVSCPMLLLFLLIRSVNTFICRLCSFVVVATPLAKYATAAAAAPPGVGN